MGREINVKLGSVALKNFPRVNDTSTERSFDISLSECAALAKPEIAFRDKYVSAQQADPTILSLKSGGAAGFGIVVKNGLDQQRIRFDGTPYPMRRVGDSADLPLSAAYIRIGAEGELKAGSPTAPPSSRLPSPERRRRSFPGVSRPASGSAVRPLSRQPSRRLGPSPPVVADRRRRSAYRSAARPGSRAHMPFPHAEYRYCVWTKAF